LQRARRGAAPDLRPLRAPAGDGHRQADGVRAAEPDADPHRARAVAGPLPEAEPRRAARRPPGAVPARDPVLALLERVVGLRAAGEGRDDPPAVAARGACLAALPGQRGAGAARARRWASGLSLEPRAEGSYASGHD